MYIRANYYEFVNLTFFAKDITNRLSHEENASAGLKTRKKLSNRLVFSKGRYFEIELAKLTSLPSLWFRRGHCKLSMQVHLITLK